MSTPILPVATEAALSKQLDQPGTFVAASFGGAVAAILADADAAERLEFLGLKMNLSAAFGIAAAAFIISIFVLSQACWRIAELLRNADPDSVPAFLSSVFTNSWSMNPFAYFGPRPFALFHAAIGAGLLAFVWWTACIALALLKARWGALDAFSYGLYYAFRVGGVLAVGSVAYVHLVIGQRLGGLVRVTEDDAWKATEVGYRRAAWARAALAGLVSAAGAAGLYAFTHIGA